MFVALTDTIRRFEIPPEPLVDLLVAFRQDQRTTRYETFDQLLDYCRYSANPVGRLVLYLGGCHDPQRARLADSISTGLQLANFWQDVARDWDRGRIYLPLSHARRFGYDLADFARRESTDAFRRLMAFEVDEAESWLRRGWPLVRLVSDELRLPVALFVHGGLAILDAIRRADYDVWTARPTVTKWEKLRLLGQCWWRLKRGSAVGRGRTMNHAQCSIDESYAFCRALAGVVGLELLSVLRPAAAGQASGDGRPVRLHASHRRPGRQSRAGRGATNVARTAGAIRSHRALARRADRIRRRPAGPQAPARGGRHRRAASTSRPSISSR